MAMTQTITITDTSGDTYTSVDGLMTKMSADLPTIDTLVSKIERCIADGTLVSSSELTEGGTGASITRVWDDVCWEEFQALDGNNSDFSDAGWTVVSENSTHFGITTRSDETFGEE